MNENSHIINDDLLVKYLLGEAGPEESSRAEQWIDADPPNRRYYEHFTLIWQQSQHLPGEFEFPVDEEAAWQKFRLRVREAPARIVPKTLRIHWQTSLSPVTKPAVSRSQWIRIAALFLLITSIAGMGYLFFGHSTTATLTVRTRLDVFQDTLPDGSIVILNKHSVLSCPEKFRDTTRTTELQGEAFFRISPDKARPFLVHTNGITIKVLGTSFNVRNKERTTEVIAETGLIQVSNQYRSILLRPSERIILQKNDSSPVKSSVTDGLYKYYRTREFVCDNTPLSKLAEVLNEAYNVHIAINSPALRNLPLSTTFRDESLDHILSVIGETFGITISRTGDQIILQ